MKTMSQMVCHMTRGFPYTMQNIPAKLLTFYKLFVQRVILLSAKKVFTAFSPLLTRSEDIRGLRSFGNVESQRLILNRKNK